MNQVLDALAGTEREMVFFPKSEHAGHSLPPPFPFFFGKRGRCADSYFQSPLDDLLGRTAHAASERRFEHLLPVGRELDHHRHQYNLD